jgi:hypothetical protein
MTLRPQCSSHCTLTICGEKLFLFWKLLVWKIFLGRAPSVPGIAICTAMHNKHVHVQQFIKRITIHTVLLLGKYFKVKYAKCRNRKTTIIKVDIISWNYYRQQCTLLGWTQKRKDLWTHSHTKFMYFCGVQLVRPCNVCVHVYTPTYILLSFNTENQEKLLLFTCNKM